MCPVRPDDVEVVAAGSAGSSGVHRASGDLGGAVDGEIDEDNEDVEQEEVVQAKPAEDPRAPAEAEREAHAATHLPFRSWCPE